MNPIDEDVLTNALHDVANSFDISSDAASRIAIEAASAEATPRLVRLPAFIQNQSRGRVILVAAAFVVVVGAISVPLLRGEESPTRNFSALKSRVHGESSTVHLFVAPGVKSAAPSPPAGAAITGNTTVVGNGSATSASSPAGSLKIESTGAVALTVQGAKVSPAFSKLTSLVTSDGGFVNSTNAHVGTRGSGQFSYGTIVLQVPQHSFALLVAQVQRVGRTTSVSSNSADVTSQYVDLTARITAFKASRQQYLAIMKHATTIGGILAVQSQLNNLQSQIEQLQGELNVLNNETTYGTLSVTVSEAGQHSLVVHPRTGFSKAWHDSIRGFVSGFEWLIRIAGPALFALLLLGALSFLGRFAWRANRRRRI